MTAQTKRLIVLALSCGFAVISGCSQENDPAASAQAQADSAQPAAPTNRVDIPVTVRQNLGITFAKVQRRNVANTLRMPGAFELEPLARREYRLMLPGQVEFMVNQFDRVEAGTPLYRFHSPQWPELQHEIVEAEQAIAAAQAQIEVAEAELAATKIKQKAHGERMARLAAAEFKRADLEVEAAELAASIPTQQAEVNAAKTALDNARRVHDHAIHRASTAVGLSPESLTAPVQHEGRTVPRFQTIEAIEVKATAPGVVESLGVTNGSFVEAATLLLTIVDPARVRFRAIALQSDLSKLAAGQPAWIVPPRDLGGDTGARIEAELTIGLDADPQQRTVTLFAKPRELRPWTRQGVSAFLEVATESSGGIVLAIPKSAVAQDGLTHIIFRRDPADPNKAIRTEADLGINDGQWVEVRSGLSATDEVVLDGVYELKLATARSGATQKGGHFHADGTFHDED